jgi:hypothetical protein
MQAKAAFDAQIADADNFIAVHRLTSGDAGRRWAQMSLNRAVVVSTVAAWQAFLEKSARAVVRHLEVPQNDLSRPAWELLNADVSGAVSRFNTPNHSEASKLFIRLGYQLDSNWRFELSGPRRSYHPGSARTELNGWVLVRHSIAHGFELKEDEAAGLITENQGGRSLRRSDAERCIDFFKRLAGLTADGLHSRFP